MDQGLNTLDPVVVNRWVSEVLKKKTANKSAAARSREELGQIFDRAEAAGIERGPFKRLIKRIEFEASEASYSEEEKEQLDKLKASLGDLGQWAAANPISPTEGSSKKGGGAVPTKAVAASMTLAEAKTIVAVPRKRGRASAARVEAERVIAEHDKGIADDAGLGASGPKAAAIAEAMGPDGGDTLSSLTNDDRGDNVEDLRPGFLRDKSTAA